MKYLDRNFSIFFTSKERHFGIGCHACSNKEVDTEGVQNFEKDTCKQCKHYSNFVRRNQEDGNEKNSAA